jgi:hypothetical protein
MTALQTARPLQRTPRSVSRPELCPPDSNPPLLRPEAGSQSRRGQELSVDSVHGHVPECTGRRPGSHSIGHSAASPRSADEAQRSSRLATAASVRDGVVGCLVPQPVGHAIHNPDEIARKAIPVVLMERDFCASWHPSVIAVQVLLATSRSRQPQRSDRPMAPRSRHSQIRRGRSRAATAS